ncbi:MAG: DUF4340 domain-containing protein [Lentisphaerae bacterium]|nr:DUF4340 domain-containing protein [Lentisphaerota bacterium]
MSAKSLGILFVLAIVLVGAAVMTTRREQRGAAPAAEGRLVLPDLPVNDVTKMIVVNQGATATVEKIDGIWKVAEKHGYPANFDRVRTTLITLSELKVGDQRATTPQTRQEFGLVSPDAEHPDATSLRLERANGEVVARVLLGKHHVRKAREATPYGGDFPDGRYVSPNDGTTAYMVKQTLSDVTASSMAWIETELLNVDAAELTRLSITGPDRATLELAAHDGGELEVTGLGSEEEADVAKLASLRNALTYVNLQDVADPAQADAALGFNNPVAFTAHTKDGRVFTVQVGGKADGDARYVRCRVEFQEPPPAAPAAATNAPPAPDYTATRLAVDTLNKKITPWTYIIPTYKAEAMVMTREELVKPKTPPAAEAAVTPQPDAPPPETGPSASEPPATPPAVANPEPVAAPLAAETNVPNTEVHP